MNNGKSLILILHELISSYLDVLVEDMRQFPAFDPSAPYERKNDYIVRVNRQGVRLLQWNVVAAEFFYQNLLKCILDYENENNKVFNKGTVYANLGIAQIRNGKIDFGVANLLAAEQEDKPVAPDFQILTTMLWLQFEERAIIPFILQYTSELMNIGIKIDSEYLSKLLAVMDQEDRLFFAGTILGLYQNLPLNKVNPNAFTQGRLYSSLKDLCLLIESMLRKKQAINAYLPGLLTSAIGYKNQFTTSADNLQDFLDGLETILRLPIPQDRWAATLHIVRNFTGHHFDPDEKILSSAGNSFFDLYDKILANILCIFCYLKYHGHM